jgi:glutamate dehydrogenase/leucine dehydrogenase
MEREDHEQVVFCRDRSTGLRAIVAIHDTTLGPGLGGIRMRAYPSESEALTDLADDDHLRARGILYSPDFAINAGVLINVADELGPGAYKRARALATTEKIEPTLRRIFAESTRSGVPPGTVALRFARERIAERRRAGS